MLVVTRTLAFAVRSAGSKQIGAKHSGADFKAGQSLVANVSWRGQHGSGQRKGKRIMVSHRFIMGVASLAMLSATPAGPLTTGPHTFSSDGLSLWYRVAGPERRVPVIFLHGGPGEGSQGFARTVGPLLERRLKMVYFDQRGAGHSDQPSERSRYTMGAIVNDVEALRRQLGVERIALVGHSFGTLVALEYGARFPQHVSRMILVSALPDGAAATNRECDRLAGEDVEAYQRAVAAPHRAPLNCNPFAGFAGPAMGAYMTRASGARPGTFDAMEAADRAEGVRAGGSSSQGALMDMAFTYRFHQQARLTMPVLVIAGANDRLTDPVIAMNFARTLPRGRGVSYVGAGHFIYVDARQRFANDVTTFLSP